MPADAIQVKRLKWLFGISSLFHMAFGIACLVQGILKPQLYSFYRPRIAGERSYTQASNPSSANVSSVNVSSVTFPNSSSFIQDLEHAYAKACPLETAAPRPLLILGASMDSKLGLRDVNQTWMPERHAFFGMDELNGYLLLAIVFAVSLAFQALFLYFCLQDNPLHKFRQPCIWRWLEYALTSPLQVVLIASCVLIRDVYTVTLLLAAQLVCVLLGFAVEAANANGIEEIVKIKGPTRPFGEADPKEAAEPTETDTLSPDEIHLQIDAHSNNTNAIDFSQIEIAKAAELANLIPRQERTPEEIVNQRKQNARKSLGLWLACFLAASILHAAVWYILTAQLSNLVNETDCHENPADSDADQWKAPVTGVVYGQLILFSLFALVPVLQEIAFFRGTTPATEVFLYGSVAYAVLSVIAKVVLAATYFAFVYLFPFKNRH